MTDRRLVLLRHGRTAWNAIGRGQGHCDVELDDIGHEQAATAAPHIAAYEPSVLWSSDLARARQTASYVAKETGLDSRLDERFREFDLGERTGLTMAEYAQRFPEGHADWVAGRFTAVPGGESTANVAGRFAAGLEDVVASMGSGQTGIVVAHGAALKVAVAQLVGWPAELSSGLTGLDNCGWAVLNQLDDDGRFRLAAYNLTAPTSAT